jgi:hypothetical protein
LHDDSDANRPIVAGAGRNCPKARFGYLAAIACVLVAIGLKAAGLRFAPRWNGIVGMLSVLDAMMDFNQRRSVFMAAILLICLCDLLTLSRRSPGIAAGLGHRCESSGKLQPQFGGKCGRYSRITEINLP